MAVDSSVPPTSDRGDFGMEHPSYNITVSSSALSKREKSFMSKPPAGFCLKRVVFFILTCLSFQIKSNVILFTSLLKSLGVLRTLQIKTSFESANVLIIFILPTMERSLWDHMFTVFFFRDFNLSKKKFLFRHF